jgi:hypothetical protein
MGDSGARLRKSTNLGGRKVNAVSEPDVAAQPSQVIEVLDRPHSKTLLTEFLFLERLGEVGVEPDLALPGKVRGLAHELGRYREGRAGSDRDLQHRAG